MPLFSISSFQCFPDIYFGVVMKITGERRRVDSAYEEPIEFACAQTSLETHTVPALEAHSTSKGVQGECDACVNGGLE